MGIKPKLKLSNEDGNAFFILGRAKRVAQKAGWKKEKIDQFFEKARVGDYNHLLQVCDEYFDVV